jgi:hypothetical protein
MSYPMGAYDRFLDREIDEYTKDMDDPRTPEEVEADEISKGEAQVDRYLRKKEQEEWDREHCE